MWWWLQGDFIVFDLKPDPPHPLMKFDEEASPFSSLASPISFCLLITTHTHPLTQLTHTQHAHKMTLKEDYDMTAQHIAEYGRAVRVNRCVCVNTQANKGKQACTATLYTHRLFVEAVHRTNKGGAVDAR